MKDTKFTSGPWRIREGNSRIVEDGNSEPLALCDSSVKKYSENVANANLIAAAPELYKAVEYLLNYVFIDEPDFNQPFINEAIAKARGEEINQPQGLNKEQ